MQILTGINDEWTHLDIFYDGWISSHPWANYKAVKSWQPIFHFFHSSFSVSAIKTLQKNMMLMDQSPSQYCPISSNIIATLQYWPMLTNYDFLLL